MVNILLVTQLFASMVFLERTCKELFKNRQSALKIDIPVPDYAKDYMRFEHKILTRVFSTLYINLGNPKFLSFLLVSCLDSPEKPTSRLAKLKNLLLVNKDFFKEAEAPPEDDCFFETDKERLMNTADETGLLALLNLLNKGDLELRSPEIAEINYMIEETGTASENKEKIGVGITKAGVLNIYNWDGESSAWTKMFSVTGAFVQLNKNNV